MDRELGGIQNQRRVDQRPVFRAAELRFSLAPESRSLRGMTSPVSLL